MENVGDLIASGQNSWNVATIQVRSYAFSNARALLVCMWACRGKGEAAGGQNVCRTKPAASQTEAWILAGFEKTAMTARLLVGTAGIATARARC